ncbi:lycopene cyclase domain-containing protein [Demequina mangrovi]|uniref:Lycopene cyclase domain-containing protein n=1 Tax=Demequina mangrovi TaxID=1043493 RepID=A0A1H7A4U9_9MICO|nr:lycopene cyclase domain-containing protein [Demequina mangrovi]SEJ56890.1 lycopene cyclase domain-containing protein [Demequina mangrovi]
MTYVILSVAVLALVALACLPLLRRLPHRPLLLTGAAIVALTAVFDPLIVGAGIVGYDEELISGLRWAGAPVEDVAYALAAVMLVPTLWTLLGPAPTPAPTPPTAPDRDTHHA